MNNAERMDTNILEMKWKNNLEAYEILSIYKLNFQLQATVLLVLLDNLIHVTCIMGTKKQERQDKK
jgi:hypothetical protein